MISRDKYLMLSKVFLVVGWLVSWLMCLRGGLVGLVCKRKNKLDINDEDKNEKTECRKDLKLRPIRRML